MIVRDLNIHINDKLDLDTITFNDFLEAFGLVNTITFPMHRLQITLDLIVTYQAKEAITGYPCQGRLFLRSQHCVL